MRVAITTTSFAAGNPEPLRLLEEARIEIAPNELGRKLDPEETLRLCSNCVGILAGTERYDEKTLTALPGLRVISRIGTGVDNIDRDAAASLGIEVRNTPDGPTDAVVELTIGVMFDMLRHLSATDRDMRAGVWKKRMGNLLSGKRVGIVGLGRIGGRVAAKLGLLGCDVAYCDVRPEDGDVPYSRMPFEALLGWADILSVHCTAPGDACGPMIGEGALAMMRPGTWLVNASRGELVDETALADALESGHLAGAAIDVFADEPYRGRLLECENVVLTPHIGSYASECRQQMEIDAVQNLLGVLRT